MSEHIKTGKSSAWCLLLVILALGLIPDAKRIIYLFASAGSLAFLAYRRESSQLLINDAQDEENKMKIK